MTDAGAPSPVHSPRWTVLDYDENVLAHRVPLAEALGLVLAGLAGLTDSASHLWPLFSLSRAPIAGAGEGEPVEGGLLRTGAVPAEALAAGGIVVDVRDAVAVDPALDIGGAAECIYHAFRNIDVCELAYRDMGLLFNWPADRVNHIALLDPLFERHLRERHAGPLAEGLPVHLVFDRTRLTHLDELHMWVLRQIFYFHACPLGRYEEPDEVYGFSHSRFAARVVLAFGCAPHAHEMALGIAFDVDEPLEVDGDALAELSHVPPLRLEPRFIAHVEALLAGG